MDEESAIPNVVPTDREKWAITRFTRDMGGSYGPLIAPHLDVLEHYNARANMLLGMHSPTPALVLTSSPTFAGAKGNTIYLGPEALKMILQEPHGLRDFKGIAAHEIAHLRIHQGVAGKRMPAESKNREMEADALGAAIHGDNAEYQQMLRSIHQKYGASGGATHPDRDARLKATALVGENKMPKLIFNEAGSIVDIRSDHSVDQFIRQRSQCPGNRRGDG